MSCWIQPAAVEGLVGAALLGSVLTLVCADEIEVCVGQRPHCGLPVAASVPAGATHSAAPVVPSWEDDPCLTPRALCNRPAPQCVRDDVPRCSRDSQQLLAILQSWSTASAGQPAWTDRDREWLHRQAGGDLSAHALDLVLKLTQPVNASALMADFDWRILASNVPMLLLSATPREETARLFCSELQIELDATGRPRTVEVVHRAGRKRLLIQRDVVLANAVVEVDGDLPPSPSSTAYTPLVRFAAELIEVEREAPR